MKNYIQAVKCTAIEITASEEAKSNAKSRKPSYSSFGRLQYDSVSDLFSVEINVSGESKKASLGDFLVTYEDGSQKLVLAEDFKNNFTAVDTASKKATKKD